MKPKDYLANQSKGLIEEFNQILKNHGITTKEMPFFISKVQFGLQENLSRGINAEKKCVEWDSKLVERTNPVTRKKYWLLERYCVKYED